MNQEAVAVICAVEMGIRWTWESVWIYLQCLACAWTYPKNNSENLPVLWSVRHEQSEDDGPGTETNQVREPWMARKGQN